MAEEDPWAFDEGEADKVASAKGSAAGTPKGPSTPKAESKIGTPAEPGTPAPGGEEEEAAPPPPPPEDDGYRKPVQLYRHWVRPKFLQYKYMYNYRTNYYDDVIDYLDKRQRGISREIPQPQTWAERVLRTNAASGRSVEAYQYQHKDDSHLIQTLPASIKTHNYHTRAYINQKYAHVL